jgi:predicted nucleic acid-binding protein
VIDTNVWIDAGNKGGKRWQDALGFVVAMLESSTRLCVDGERIEGSDVVGSKILGEYKEKLLEAMPSSIGAQVLQTLLSTGRVRRVSLKTTDFAQKWAEQSIGDPDDWKFVFVAINSRDKALVSHDEKHFGPAVRNDARRLFKAAICFADEARPYLRP